MPASIIMATPLAPSPKVPQAPGRYKSMNVGRRTGEKRTMAP
jgi:hypothetical protein